MANLRHISIGGRDYPCAPTMGAMLRYERETGKSINEMSTFSDSVAYMWCCCASACSRDGVDFPFTLMQFADSLSPEDLAKFNEQSSDDDGGDGKAKKK